MAEVANVCFRRTAEAPGLANGLPLTAREQSFALKSDGKVCQSRESTLEWKAVVRFAPLFLPKMCQEPT